MAKESNTNGADNTAVAESASQTSKRGRKPARFSLNTLKAITVEFQRGNKAAVEASGYKLIPATTDNQGFAASYPVLQSPEVLTAEDNRVMIIRYQSEGDYAMTPGVEVLSTWEFNGKKFVEVKSAE